MTDRLCYQDDHKRKHVLSHCHYEYFRLYRLHDILLRKKVLKNNQSQYTINILPIKPERKINKNYFEGKKKLFVSLKYVYLIVCQYVCMHVHLCWSWQISKHAIPSLSVNYTKSAVGRESRTILNCGSKYRPTWPLLYDDVINHGRKLTFITAPKKNSHYIRRNNALEKR